MGSLIIPLTADQDLCVPVNNEISLSDKMMRRATNSVVYAQMEKDINRAIQCFKMVGEKRVFTVRICLAPIY